MIKTTVSVKRLTKLDKDQESIYVDGKDLPSCDGKYIEEVIPDDLFLTIVALLPITSAFFAGSCFILYVGFSPNSNAELGFIWLGVIIACITGPSIIYLLLLKKRGPQNGEAIFDRTTGNVLFSKFKGNDAFEIPFKYLDLYITKLSMGKGGWFYQAYFIPSEYPAHVKKPPKYVAAFHFRSKTEAEYIWGVYCAFMDKSKPIPLHFFKYMQALIDSPYDPEITLKVDDELKKFAPFHDVETDTVVRKEVW